jgi:hypothetical protein
VGKEARVYGWDVEAVEWDRPVLAIVTSEDGDETVFKGPKCLEGVRDHMRRHQGVYLAHYGGGYDVPLLMNVRGFPEIVLSGTNILCAREGQGLTLRDTFPWWLASLAAVGDAVGLPKLDVDRGDVGALSERELIDYCARDVRILLKGYEACRGFLEAHGAKLSWTAGSSAVSLVRALEPGPWRALKRRRNRVEDVTEFIDDGAGRGGRTECPARGIVEGVTSLDFKSSYPARYASREVGIGQRRATDSELRGAVDPGGVYLSRWSWPHRDRLSPALDFASSCGYGPAESWLLGEEVSLFEERGVSVERVRGWLPEETCEVGQTFADVMFRAKEGSGPAKFFSKVFLNSWHGKALEHPLKEHFTRWRPARYVEAFGVDVLGDRERRPDATWFRYYTVECGDDDKCAEYQQPVMGEQILGRARAALFRDAFALFEAAGVPVLYCDTDSCHVKASEARCREILGDRIGSTIGKLAIEATACVGYYLGPKAYLLVDDAGDRNRKKDGTFYARGDVVKAALKGIPLRSYARGTVDADGLYREARKGEAASDVRVRLFEQALAGKPARCLKDGVSTFLRGAHGFEDAEGKRVRSRWGRAPQVREVRPSGRGKTWGGDRAWRYASILETVADATLRRLARRPLTAAEWERLPEEARGYLLACTMVAFVDVNEDDESYRVQIVEEGRRRLDEIGQGAIHEKDTAA